MQTCPALAPPSQTDAPAVDEWFFRTGQVWDAAHVRLQRAISRQKDQADHHRSEVPVFQLGDRVWLSTLNLPLRLPCKKLSPGFAGPFKVLQRINEVSYRLLLPPHYLLFMCLSSGRWFLVLWRTPSPGVRPLHPWTLTGVRSML
ncbi:hypothetical protein J4Q44_G00225100 [Coregonus suidteri]|uniref:Tf2-1-like SH3-like domain-containing protein n=1 Tax=Coregonus suidteri TaxID=861788 RepID=A0AAN8LF84_9TELE